LQFSTLDGRIFETRGVTLGQFAGAAWLRGGWRLAVILATESGWR
jgi:hypothetical protein